MKVKFLRNCGVAGVSHVAGTTADVTEADARQLVSIGRAEYANAADDPATTADPADNPSIVPDALRSLDPEIRKAATGAIEETLAKRKKAAKDTTIETREPSVTTRDPVHKTHPK